MMRETIGQIGSSLSEMDAVIGDVRAHVARAAEGFPPNTDVVVLRRDHDLGTYGTVALEWNPMDEPDDLGALIRMAEAAVRAFEDSFDWSEPRSGEERANA